MDSLKLIVLSKPGLRHLSLLDRLPPATQITIGDSLKEVQHAATEADVILNGMAVRGSLETVLPLAKKVRWIHSLSAGVENVLFPELVESSIPVTNARGVFKRSLAEFVLAGILFFAKDLRRMLRNQANRNWEAFDIEEIHGKVMGVVGYGEIGRAAAERGHALGMKVIALRRRPELSKDHSILSKAYTIEERVSLMAESDYVVCAAPLTPATRGLVGARELKAMKKSAVIVNVGRGPVISEPALIEALQQSWIRGAVLDVFDEEPLPKQHPFWGMENVLLSPHCADHTPDWLEKAMQLFLDNFDRFQKGEALQNVIDKKAGY